MRLPVVQFSALWAQPRPLPLGLLQCPIAHVPCMSSSWVGVKHSLPFIEPRRISKSSVSLFLRWNIRLDCIRLPKSLFRLKKFLKSSVVLLLDPESPSSPDWLWSQPQFRQTNGNWCCLPSSSQLGCQTCFLLVVFVHTSWVVSFRVLVVGRSAWFCMYQVKHRS